MENREKYYKAARQQFKDLLKSTLTIFVYYIFPDEYEYDLSRSKITELFRVFFCQKREHIGKEIAKPQINRQF